MKNYIYIKNNIFYKFNYFCSIKTHILVCILLFYSVSLSQNNFVKIKNENFYLNDSLFIFHGVNAYYLYHLAAYEKKDLIDTLMIDLKKLKTKVIRINAHYESESLTDNAVIMTNPYSYNENALKSLDYVLNKADEYNMKLILVLNDNWNYYGGIDKYLDWAKALFKKNFSHNDFFTNDSIRNWYKDFIRKIILRKNTINKKYYYEDETIFSWEIINEPRSTDNSGEIIYHWMKDISEFIRDLDKNHLIGSGEEGFDINQTNYSDPLFFYENNKLLFNGYYGISFSKNTSLHSIDYANIHTYPRGYGYNILANKQWISDHSAIAKKYNKPLLVSEYGFYNNTEFEIARTLNIFKNEKNVYGLYWQYSLPNTIYKDKYSINFSENSEICKKIIQLCELLEQKKDTTINYDFEVFQNYPNPFRNVTTLRINLLNDDRLTLKIFDIQGKLKKILNEIELKKGINEFVLDLNPGEFSSGTYFLSYEFNRRKIFRKLIILK